MAGKHNAVALTLGGAQKFNPKVDRAYSEGRGNTAAKPPLTDTLAAAAWQKGADLAGDAGAQYETAFGVGGAAVQLTGGVFDGSAWAVKTGGFGAPDTPDGTISFWRDVGSLGTNQTIVEAGIGLSTAASDILIRVQEYATLGYSGDSRSAAGALVGDGQCARGGVEPSGNGLQHVMFTFQSGGTGELYVNGVQVAQDLTVPAENMNWTASSAASIMNDRAGSRPPSLGTLAEVWVGPGYRTDTTDFRADTGGNGTPVDLGVSGVAGGITPYGWLGGPGYDWTAASLVNRGSTGGTLTVTGTITSVPI